MRKNYLYVAFIMISLSALIMAISFRNSFALSSDWYTNYTYELDEENNTIKLTRYNGEDTEVTIPATVTIDDKTYSVLVTGGTTTKSLFGSNSNITKVTFENGVKGVGSLRNMFYGCSNLEEINFNNFDTSEATSFYYMFYGCKSLISLNLSSFNTENVISMTDMFYGCSSLESINLSSFNTSNVENMSGMFRGCSKLETLDLSHFNTSKVTDVSHMFQSCASLKELNISSFTSESITTVYYMFQSTSVEKIYLGHFDFLYPDRNAYNFGRGTWERLEDGKKYAAVDIVYESHTRDISGTYVKKSNIIEDMFINYNVTYNIGQFLNIDDVQFSDENMFEVRSNAFYVKNLNKTSTDDYVVSGNIKVLFKDIVTDKDGNKYNLRLTLDNIHLYDLNNDEITEENFDHQLMYISSGILAMGSYNYKAGTTTGVSGASSSASKFDVTLEVVDDSGVAQEGSYVFSALDLDIPAARDKDGPYPFGSGSGWGNYSEGINLIEGYDDSTYKVYDRSFIKREGNRIFGYHVDSSSEFTEFSIKVSATKFKYAWTGQGCATTVLRYYHPQPVEIIKKDQNGNNLAGASLELYSGNTLVESWTSTSEAHKVFLNTGYYTLKETGAPTNYVKSSDIHFYVDVDGSIVSENKKVDNIVVNNNGKPVSVIINYIDETNNTQLEKVTDSAKYGDEYTSSAKSFEGYALIRRPEIETVTLNQDETVFNYYYAKISGGVIEKHIDVITNNILSNETHSGNVGDDYNILSKTFEGYDLVTDSLPDNSVGKMKEEVTEVIYYYKPKAEIKVKYLDKDTGNPIIEDIDIQGYVNDDYTSEEKELPGYILVDSQGETSGKLNSTNDDVVYYYQRVVYVTTEVKAGGGTISGDETVYYHNDSTPENIVIEANDGYFIRKIMINNEEIEIADDYRVVLEHFVNMEENKHITVEFQSLTSNVPKTDMNSFARIIGMIMLVIGIVFVFLSRKKQINDLA